MQFLDKIHTVFTATLTRPKHVYCPKVFILAADFSTINVSNQFLRTMRMLQKFGRVQILLETTEYYYNKQAVQYINRLVQDTNNTVYCRKGKRFAGVLPLFGVVF